MIKYIYLILSLFLHFSILIGYLLSNKTKADHIISKPLIVQITNDSKEIVNSISSNNETTENAKLAKSNNKADGKESKSHLDFRQNYFNTNAIPNYSSTTTSSIEELPLNKIDNLNTKEFAYWGYYQDIRERIEMYWGKSLDILARGLLKDATFTSTITGLIVTIDQKGQIDSISLKRSSSVSELDHAAIDAFNKAGPFPNPPQGILKESKAIIEWQFIVNA